MKRAFFLLVISALALSCAPKGPQPVNPSATPEARELLSFLYSISGTYTLSGEHNFASDLSRYDDEVFAMTGKRPVVWGSDFSFNDIGEGFERYQHAGPLSITVPFERPCVHTGLTVEEGRQGIVNEAIAQARLGLMWHCCDPRFTDGGNDCNGDKVWTMDNAPSAEEWDQLCTDGTPLNAAWKREMDSVIPYLAQLQEAGVPVLWRPYHEMNGAWFWWGNKPGENGFKRLWIMTYEYFTAQGLNNLLWARKGKRRRPGLRTLLPRQRIRGCAGGRYLRLGLQTVTSRPTGGTGRGQAHRHGRTGPAAAQPGHLRGAAAMDLVHGLGLFYRWTPRHGRPSEPGPQHLRLSPYPHPGRNLLRGRQASGEIKKHRSCAAMPYSFNWRRRRDSNIYCTVLSRTAYKCFK